MTEAQLMKLFMMWADCPQKSIRKSKDDWLYTA